jgi:S-adenosylmethionine synthetase
MAGVAEACEVRLAYAIGVAEPIAVHFDLGGGYGFELDAGAAACLLAHLRPRAIIDRLELTSPKFWDAAAFPFGCPTYAWEIPDVEVLHGVPHGTWCT